MINYPYLGRSYGLVDAMLRFSGSYALSLQNSTAAARDLHGKPLTQPIPFQGAEVLALTRAHGHSTGFNFPIADYQQIGNPLNRVLADFIADLFISQVRFHAQTLIYQGFFNFPGISGLPIGNIQDHCVLLIVR